MKIRSSGVLLHLSSLPSRFGIGDMGPLAYRFADFLANAGQRYWQILPLNPPGSEHLHSPYHSISAFAFNPLFISPELLKEQGLLSNNDLKTVPVFPKGRVNYHRASSYKQRLLNRAYKCFGKGTEDHEFRNFCAQNTRWLDDFCLFRALLSRFPGKKWNEWKKGLQDRKPNELRKTREVLSDAIHQTKFLQYICFRQWMSLKSYCHEKGIQIIGDMPIYVQYNSADLWAYPKYFKLDVKKRPLVVAGVPPDYFSETGQLWGNPIYRWDILKKKAYDWWIERIAHNLQLFDFLRIDHFRGLVSYWEVPANEKDATNGKWVEGPGDDFLCEVLKKFPHAPFIAEDLGFITSDVREALHRFRLPGMRVLLFAFNANLPANTHAPHNLFGDCVLYTGTHDNNTARGWFESEANPETRKRLSSYLGRRVSAKDVSWELIRLAMMSVADTVIIPMQDILALGAEARMNHPGKKRGNWQWQLLVDQLTSAVNTRLLRMTQIFGRT